MKTAFKILGWIFALASFAMTYLFYSQYSVSKSDLQVSGGIVSSNPTISTDEYDSYDTGLKFNITGAKGFITVPGKLLAQSDSSIYNLKIGDEVNFYEVSELSESRNNLPRIAFGLWTKERSFYTVETALAFYKSPKFLIFSVFFLAFGILIIYYLLKYPRIQNNE